MKAIIALCMLVSLFINYVVITEYNKMLDNTRVDVIHLAFNSYMVGCKIEHGADCDIKAGEYVRPIKELNGN